MEPIIFLHHGNTKVMQWLEDNYPLLPNIGDTWIIKGKEFNTLDERIEYLKETKQATTITPAELRAGLLTLHELNSQVQIVKIITTYDSDINHLEPQWNIFDYDKDQWIENVRFGLGIIANIEKFEGFEFKLDDFTFEQSPIKKTSLLMFTPGRSGTHLLHSEVNYRYCELEFHNNHKALLRNLREDQNNNNDYSFFNELIHADSIITAFRDNFRSAAFSDFMIEKTNGHLVSTHQNYDSNVKYCNEKFHNNCTITEDDITSFLSSLLTFTDMLFLLHYLGKPVYVIQMGELIKMHNNREYLKNPYSVDTVLSNIDDFDTMISKFEPIFNSITSIINANMLNLLDFEHRINNETTI